jgi:hypothetical protein
VTSLDLRHLSSHAVDLQELMRKKFSMNRAESSTSKRRDRNDAGGPTKFELGVALFFAFAFVFLLGFYGLSEERRYERLGETRTSEFVSSFKGKLRRDCGVLAPEAQKACLTRGGYDARLQMYANERDEADLVAQRKSALWTSITGLCALIGMGLSAIGVWLVWTTFRETRRTANAALNANAIAETNAHRQMRPYIWVEAAWLADTECDKPTAYIHTKNYGQTPALSYQGWKHTWVAPFPLDDALPEPLDGQVDMSNGILAPGQHTESIQPLGGTITPESRAMIEAGTAAFYVYGYSTYIDIFGKKHFYRFTYFSTADGFRRGRLAAYTSGNLVGSD